MNRVESFLRTTKIVSTRKNKIAVRLDRQPVLPVCEEALSDWKRHTQFKSCDVSVRNRLDGKNLKAWLDKELFKRAIVSLMDIAARECGDRKKLSFSIIPGWQGACRIIIGFPLKTKNLNADETDIDFRPDWDALEIISQHRGKIEVEEGKRYNQFLIHIPC